MTLLDAARQVGRIAAINARGAKRVSGFVELFDRLAAVADGQIEELLGYVLTRDGLRGAMAKPRPIRRMKSGWPTSRNC